MECGLVEGQSRITGINVSDFSLAGAFPPGLGKLTGLRSLVVAGNKFNGTIPADIAQCIHLEVSQSLLSYLITLLGI